MLKQFILIMLIGFLLSCQRRLPSGKIMVMFTQKSGVNWPYGQFTNRNTLQIVTDTTRDYFKNSISIEMPIGVKPISGYPITNKFYSAWPDSIIKQP